MRIIAGRYRSRQLKGTPPAGTRPTSDKLRGTIFDILGPRIEGAAFLDGYAGMGGIGIEAISRGARDVVFVDSSRKACAAIRENLAALRVESGFRVLEMELRRALDLLERQGAVFDIVFLDPPYEREDLYTGSSAGSLEAFGMRSLLAEDGVLVVEHSKRFQLPEAAGTLRKYRTLIQGDSGLSFYAKAEGETGIL